MTTRGSETKIKSTKRPSNSIKVDYIFKWRTGYSEEQQKDTEWLKHSRLTDVNDVNNENAQVEYFIIKIRSVKI